MRTRGDRALTRGWGRAAPLVALALLTAAGCAGSTRPATPPATASAGTALDMPLPDDLTRIPLTTSTGATTSLAALRGRTLVINDTMTLCQETCSLDTANLVRAARTADRTSAGAKVMFLSITVDPARDNPPQLAAYRALFAPAPDNWLTLTGSPADLTKLWKRLGVWYQKAPEGTPPAVNWRTGQRLDYDVNHADELLFIDPRGHERRVISGPANVRPGAALPSTLRGYLDPSGVDSLNHPHADTWTVQDLLDALHQVDAAA